MPPLMVRTRTATPHTPRPRARPRSPGGYRERAVNLRSWWRRSSVAVRRASTSPAASAAISSAVRPTLKTASSKATCSGRTRRALAVAVSRSGTQITIASSRASGTRTARPPATATTPPYTEAATLSACPSSTAAFRNISARASRSGRPCCTHAAYRPPTRAAPEKPRPRPPGKRARTVSGPTPSAWRKARTAGCVSGAGSAPSQETSRWRPSATATASNAEPRFADDAGTRTTKPLLTRHHLCSRRITCAHAGQPRAELSEWRGTHRKSRYVSPACDANVRGPGAARWPLPPSRSMRARSRFGSTRPAVTARVPASCANVTRKCSDRRKVGESKIAATRAKSQLRSYTSHSTRTLRCLLERSSTPARFDPTGSG